MIVLGIDPGVATIGFGVIRAERGKNTLLRYGVITTPPGIPLSSRLLQIDRDMEELIHTFQPDEMAVEELFFSKNITTGIAVAHGRGVILLAAERLGVPIFEYTHAGEAGGGGLRRGGQAAGHADDPAPAEHEADPQAGRRRRRPGHRHLPREVGYIPAEYGAGL